MIKTLPIFMRKSKIFNEIFTSEEKQLNVLETDLNDVRLQMDINTATWGLDIFEKELEIKTDYSKPLDDRRSVIKSKLRGSGKADSILIKVVADSYTNGDVIVSFNGQIVIKFTSNFGIPPNLEDVKTALENVKPAHLGIKYEFKYLIIKDLHNKVTLEELQTITLDKFAGGDGLV
jgi:Uncharacterised protein conserved in bacteria (DUF2313)